MSLIGKQVGNYQIKAKLGEGGMGAVYLGEHPLIGKRVAVKVLLEELAAKEEIVTRFFNEAKAVNDIGHQNIVDIVDFGKMKSDVGTDIVYFIMEFLDGESLAARARRTGMAFNETLHCMQQCCSALAASHAKGIVHRDLKPENIYLCTRGSDANFIKILDFGIAKLTGEGSTSSHKTRTGLVIGTPTYMSPEQCEGKGLIDSRSDVYSLGVVMYEMLTGRVPFPGEGFGEILVAHLMKEPERPSTLNPDITPELEAIVMHAIEKDRTKRFQTMDEFGSAVADVAGHFAVYKPTPTVSYTGAMPIAASPTGSMPMVATSTQPRPTTLSGSATEMGTVPAVKSRTPLFAGLAALLVAGGAIAVFTTRKPAPVAQPTPVAQPIVAPPVDTSVMITISTDPPGAEVLRGGTALGAAPVKIQAHKGDPSFSIEVKKAGYMTAKREVETSTSRELSVALAPLTAPAETPIAETKKPTGHSSTRHATQAAKPKSSSPAGDDMALLPLSK